LGGETLQARNVSRKIVLLSDGTGNSAAQVWRTNVWRVFESLDLANADQVSYYDDGVGTSSFKPLAILGGAFGYGLKRNVLDLYKFVCRNHRERGDEIFGFGFSRGAFTIRVVIALILQQGLVNANSEAELHAKAKAAYREYRRDNFHTFWRIEYVARWIRDLFIRTVYDKSDNRHDVTVRFLGLWDTVAAYGMPVDEMTRGISQWIWPLQLPDTVLNPRVKRACHALSIDDERTTFHPVLWDERNEEPLEPRADHKRYLADERVSQVWFAGMHANVGGGYPDDSVALIPLVWILSEAQAAGLAFKSDVHASPQTFGHPGTAQDPNGRIYDSRSGLASYYRYGPRNILELGKDLLTRRGGEVLPRIHESVLIRIRNNAHLYAPKGLPERYEIVKADGEVLPPEQNPYERPDQARARANTQDRVWNTVWWRLFAYFATVLVSAYLFIFPLLRLLPVSDQLGSRLRWVSDIVGVIDSFLPSAADTWINAYQRAPGKFLVVIVLLILVTWWGSFLAARIQNRMEICWRRSLGGTLVDPGKPQDWVYRLRNNSAAVTAYQVTKRYIAPALFALLCVYLGVTLASHGLSNIGDDFGLVCRERQVQYGLENNVLTVKDFNGLKDLLKGETLDPKPIFNTTERCQSLGVWVEANRNYLVQFGKTADAKPETDSFRFASIDASHGFRSTETGSLLMDPLMIAAMPLRRDWFKPWFEVVIRIGGRGGEEAFIDADPKDQWVIDSPFTATRDGELFIFVNAPVIGIPGLYDYFYRFNDGQATVTLKRIN
jgi:uncharacterized protein (DUF2235 family)